MEFLNKLQDAQMVLVGIGKEMEEDFAGMKQDSFYQELLERAAEEERPVLEQYLKLHYIKRHGNPKRKEAYERLAALLEEKNYFVVTLCTDDYIFDAGLDESRIVAPCGGYRAMQCAKAGGACAEADRACAEADRACAEADEEGRPLCATDQEALVADSRVWEEVLAQLDQGRENPESICVDFPVCAECMRPLFFNQISTPGYREEGYLPQWERYTKWLQGTLNRELCILELGAGMEYPSVIRFPFEKVAFFNQKAHLFRVHSRLYQLTEELKEKGTSVKTDPTDFLIRGLS